MVEIIQMILLNLFMEKEFFESKVEGQRSKVKGRRSKVHGQWSMVNGQWSIKKTLPIQWTSRALCFYSLKLIQFSHKKLAVIS